MRSKNQEHFTLLENFIDAYIDSQGVSPSTREIAAGTDSRPRRYLAIFHICGIME